MPISMPAPGEDVERRDALGDMHRVVQRQRDHGMSQADPARALRQRGEQELGLGGMRIAAHEVMLDQPRAAITEAVGQLDFGKRVGVGLRFAADRLRRQGDFVEQIELHRRALRHHASAGRKRQSRSCRF